MNHHLRQNSRSLDNTGVRRQIAAEHGHAALLHIRMIDRVDDLRISDLAVFNQLADRFSVNRLAVKVQCTELRDLVHDGVDAAGLVQLFHIVRACRCQMTDIRRLLRKFIGYRNLKVDAALMRNGRQMQHGIGRAAERHIDGQGIHEGFLRHDVAGTDVLPDTFHDLHAGMLCQLQTGRIYGGNGTVAFQPHAQHLCETVHGVGGIHTRAGTAGRADILLEIPYIIRRHGAGRIGADSLKHG